MNYYYRKLSSILLCLAISMGVGCQQIKPYKMLPLGHGLPTTHPVHQAMVYMAQRVEAKSNGKLRIKIYSDAQLGEERVLTELIQIGSLAMTKVSASVMTNFAPEYGVLETPYLYKDQEHGYRVMEGPIGKEILSKGEQFWLRGLCFYDAGSRSFYSKEKPILSPEDLKGLKIRVQNSQNMVNMVNALGGSATPIPYGELYTALQQGVVDGAENNPPSLFTSRHYEVCKYYALDQHTSTPDVLIISTRVWESLTDEEKNWLQEAADESAQEQKKLWAASVEESMAKMKEAGLEVYYPEKEPFIEKIAPLIQQMKEQKPEVYAFYEKIKAVE